MIVMLSIAVYFTNHRVQIQIGMPYLVQFR
jgi:hypothetical protein